jgi:hypothetical protein
MAASSWPARRSFCALSRYSDALRGYFAMACAAISAALANALSEA